jgi:hypothetical protein
MITAITRLEPAHQGKNQDDYENEPYDSRRAVTPSAAITPRREGADKNEQQYDEKYRS